MEMKIPSGAGTTQDKHLSKIHASFDENFNGLLKAAESKQQKLNLKSHLRITLMRSKLIM